MGLLAGAVLALTPVATLMARYNNPDELMLLLLVAAAYALARSIGAPQGGTWWLMLCGALLGVSFLAKLLQAWLVLPPFAVVVLMAGAGSLRRRVGRLLAAGTTMLVSAGCWVLLVMLTPADERPWIGGSRSNSVLELTLGYNGLGRLTGQEASGGASNGARHTSWLRLVTLWAPEASWLLPAGLVAALAGWQLTRGRERRDPLRAGLLLWAGWLILVGIALSALRGIAHGYYTLELAPAVAGCVALGGAALWRLAAAQNRRQRPATVLLAALVAGNAVWAVLLLMRNSGWPSVVVPTLLGLGSLAVGGLVLSPGSAPRTGAETRRPRRAPVPRPVLLLAILLSGLLAPATWSIATAATAHRGANIATGPGPAAFVDRPGISPGSHPGDTFPVAVAHRVHDGAAGYVWAAAVVGHRAADLQLASRSPAWALGGFSGNDPFPSLPRFAAALAALTVHYVVFLPSDLRGGSDAHAIARWAFSCLHLRRIHPWILASLDQPAALSHQCRARARLSTSG